MKLDQLTNVLSLRRALRVAILLLCGLALTACSQEGALIYYLQEDPHDRYSDVNDLLGPTGQIGLESLEESYPGLFIFLLTMNDAEWTNFLGDDFYSYAIGAYLAFNPDVTYEQFRKTVSIPELADLTPETFNYYRGFGKAWFDELENADWIKSYQHRYELLKVRLGNNYQFSDDWRAVGQLLRDDERLLAVLTDDDSARRFIDEEITQGFSHELHFDLGPAYTGVPPGMGS